MCGKEQWLLWLNEWKKSINELGEGRPEPDALMRLLTRANIVLPYEVERQQD